MLSRFTSSVSAKFLRSPKRRFSISLDGFGDHVFRGAVAEPYLQKHGLSASTLSSPAWTTNGDADKVLLILNL